MRRPGFLLFVKIVTDYYYIGLLLLLMLEGKFNTVRLRKTFTILCKNEEKIFSNGATCQTIFKSRRKLKKMDWPISKF